MDASRNRTLIEGIEREDNAAVERILAQGANPNTRDAGGWPALFIAIDKGSAETVRLLLAHGADANIHREGDSALLFAVFRTHQPIVELLLRHGAAVNAIVRGTPGAATVTFVDGQSGSVFSEAEFVAGAHWFTNLMLFSG